MGADLTIQGGHGYFRDSYNPTNVLWQLDLYYWTDVERMRGPSGCLEADGIQKLLEMIRARDLPNPPVSRPEGEVMPEGPDHAYFARKKQQLERFLQHALDVGKPIEMSL